MSRVVWLLPAPVRTAHTATTGTFAGSIVASGPSSTKLAPAARTLLAAVHHVLVRDVRVGEHDLVDLELADRAPPARSSG